MSTLGDALFNKTQQQLLGLTYVRPDKSFYLKQILRRTGMGVATIKRELDRMVEAGILTLTKVGNQHHFQANPDCPIYEELLSITRKTFGIAEQILQALEPMAEQIELAFIYGSIAKGTENAKSDIDLMMVGKDLSYYETLKLLSPIEVILSRPINPVVYDREEFLIDITSGKHFLTRVLEQQTIVLTGTLDDFTTTDQPGQDRRA